MDDSPFLILLYVGVAAYVGQMYWSDFKTNQILETPKSTALPGATSASRSLYVAGVLGALLILAAETGGEIALGIAAEQGEMVWFWVFASLAAGIIEEVIFRGYLVVENKGRAALVGSCIGFSLIFACIHGHFWSYEEGGVFVWSFSTKAFFTTGFLMANSLWFYALRFGPWNQSRSLLPCMLAHAVSNLGVFGVKWVQGFIIF
jgi:membrane protease YdiL (CAAX protease family)